MEKGKLSASYEMEEGELLGDDSVELYTPLQRPIMPTLVHNNHAPPHASESDDDNLVKESSTDSDSSIKKSSLSKIRKKVLPSHKKRENVKKKNYNIWCSDIQTDILTNSLVDCNVDVANERVRDVESYNYKIANYANQNNKSKNNSLSSVNKDKRRYSGKRKYNGTYVSGKDQVKNFSEYNEIKPSIANARNILSLTTNLENSEAEIATDIANKLFEEKEGLILRALNILGKKEIISLFDETREIEASGGMLIMNGTRRRTPGGVFFYLLKTSNQFPREKINLVFLEDKKVTAEIKKRTAKEIQKMKVEKYKESLSKDDFPTLLSRTELAIKQFKARQMAEESAEVKNPPPSPATDGKDCSSDGEEQKGGDGNRQNKFPEDGRKMVSYDDNPFESEINMDLI